MITVHATRAHAESTLDDRATAFHEGSPDRSGGQTDHRPGAAQGSRPLRGLGWKEPVPGWVWREADMIEALAVRDIAAVFSRLQSLGLTQRHIAARTGQSQSEVSEVLAGRHIVSYTVLTRLADGLGIPRGYLGLAYHGPGAPVPSASLASTPATPTPPPAATTTQSEAHSAEPAIQTSSAFTPPAITPNTVASTVENVRTVVVHRCLRCNAEPEVAVWTGHEIRLLREALRMTVRRFAASLGVSDRMVSKWEADSRIRPQADNQANLDTMLARADDASRKRFAVSLAMSRHAADTATSRPRSTKPRTPQALPRQRTMHRTSAAKQEYPATVDQFADSVDRVAPPTSAGSSTWTPPSAAPTHPRDRPGRPATH